MAEALACGLPVAIGEPVNISVEVSTAGAGLVYPDSLEGTSEALRDWIMIPADEQRLMGQRGKQLFHERFDFASVARILLPVLASASEKLSTRVMPNSLL